MVVINNTGKTDGGRGRERVSSVEPTVDKILKSINSEKIHGTGRE